MLNGWLAAALVALTCLLGITACRSQKKTSRVSPACMAAQASGTGREVRDLQPGPCDSIAPRAWMRFVGTVAVVVGADRALDRHRAPKSV